MPAASSPNHHARRQRGCMCIRGILCAAFQHHTPLLSQKKELQVHCHVAKPILIRQWFLARWLSLPFCLAWCTRGVCGGSSLHRQLAWKHTRYTVFCLIAHRMDTFIRTFLYTLEFCPQAGAYKQSTTARYVLCSVRPASPCSAALKILLQAGSRQTTEILPPTNAACNRYSKVIYLVSYWPPWTVEELDIAAVFVQHLGLALLIVAKTCPHRPQSFKKVNNGQAFP